MTRFTVKTPVLDPNVPAVCVGCLTASVDRHRRLVFRRSDGSVERVCVVHWPYCNPCHAGLARLDAQQRLMTITGGVQTLLVVYAVGGALAWYDFWYPSLAILAASFVAFVVFARKARSLWGLEWARIDDVYKGGVGTAFSFRNRDYAERFAQANRDTSVPTSEAPDQRQPGQ